MPQWTFAFLRYIFRVLHLVICAHIIFMAGEAGAIQQFPICRAVLVDDGNVSGKIPAHQMSYDVNRLGSHV
jgi:hypothetical protein